MFFDYFLEGVHVCLCLSVREGRAAESAESHLSMLLLTWQRLLNWSNVASPGESETLPHTDRKHKHTLILLTHSRPWRTENTQKHTQTPTHFQVCIYAPQNTRRDRFPCKMKGSYTTANTHAQLHACVHSYTPPHIQMEMSTHTEAHKTRQRRLFLVQKAHTRARTG